MSVKAEGSSGFAALDTHNSGRSERHGEKLTFANCCAMACPTVTPFGQQINGTTKICTLGRVCAAQRMGPSIWVPDPTKSSISTSCPMFSSVTYCLSLSLSPLDPPNKKPRRFFRAAVRILNDLQIESLSQSGLCFVYDRTKRIWFMNGQISQNLAVDFNASQ